MNTPNQVGCISQRRNTPYDGSTFKDVLRLRLIHPACLAALVFILGVYCQPAKATEKVVADYMLNCQGCHLDDGRGYPQRGVPKLNGYLGNFLKVPGGREFLVQVPGSAQSELSDQRLATLLNWMLQQFSRAQLPADFKPYSTTEVARLRLHPLVNVAGLRADLVRKIEKINPSTDICASCHGAKGEGNQALSAPRLAGQSASYLTRQLTNFKNGLRGYQPEDKAGISMRALALTLNEEDIPFYARHYSTLKLAKENKPLAASGKHLYNGTCMQCHGPNAQGYEQLQSPNLNLLPDWYIAQQLSHYQSGWRGNSSSDLPGLWMRSIATHIGSPEELTQVIQYIVTLPEQK